MSDDRNNRLIAEYDACRSDEAFGALVRQHINLVFATALRQVGDAGAAEEIAQNVFVTLAQASGKLRSHPTIAGWLHQTTLNKSRAWLRSELRRRHREQAAFDQQLTAAEGDSVWSPLVPLLDEALLKLREPDRLAVIMHFMEGQTFEEVGTALGLGEDTARKRVNRCLHELTHFFQRRGFAVPALTAATPLFALASHTAPAGLAPTVITAGLAAAHSAASASTLTLVKGALKIMAWTKANTAIAVGLTAVIVAGGAATVTVKEIAVHNDEKLWRTPNFKYDLFEKVSPQVKILPTKFADWGNAMGASGNRWVAIGRPIKMFIAYAYDWLPGRIVFDSGDPEKRYDMIASLPRGSAEALRREIKDKLHLVGHPETRDTDVLLLKVSRPKARGLKPPSGWELQDPWGHFTCDNQTISTDRFSELSLAMELEFIFDKPVIDETGLTQKFNIDLKWKGDKNALKQALLDQLGLELVPGNMPVEMLVVEKTK